MHRRETEVSDVVWATAFVELDIPVSPTNRAVVEVVNHRPPVLFAKLPLSDLLRIECVDTTLRKDQMLVRKRVVDQPDVVKHRIATAPGLIPVITNAPHKLRCLRVGKQR